MMIRILIGVFAAAALAVTVTVCIYHATTQNTAAQDAANRLELVRRLSTVPAGDPVKYY